MAGDGTGTGLSDRETNLVELIVGDPCATRDRHTDQPHSAYVRWFGGELEKYGRHFTLSLPRRRTGKAAAPGPGP